MGESLSRPVIYAIAVFTGLLVVCDNSVYVSVKSHNQWWAEAMFFLPEDQRNAFRRADEHRLNGVLLHDNTRPDVQNFGYLSATYTSLRPWYGHSWNTPDAVKRRGVIWAIFHEPATVTDWFRDVKYLAIAPGTALPQALRGHGKWQTLYETPTIMLLERVDDRVRSKGSGVFFGESAR